jgi:hypothetical protein
MRLLAVETAKLVKSGRQARHLPPEEKLFAPSLKWCLA